MYWAIRNYAQLTKAIREQKPLMCFKRHKARAFVVVGGDPDRSARILKEPDSAKPRSKRSSQSFHDHEHLDKHFLAPIAKIAVMISIRFPLER